MFGMKWAELLRYLTVFFCVLAIMSCKPEYRGDGALTFSRGIFGAPNFTVEMPDVDISKPQEIKYDLTSLPVSKVYYWVRLVVPAQDEITRAERHAWGTCGLRIIENKKERHAVNLNFSDMMNSLSRREDIYLNSLYTLDFQLPCTNATNQLELIFECTGFDSLEPVWAHIQLHAGGK